MNFAVNKQQYFKKINSPQYIKFKLYITYSMIFVLFICIGGFINYFFAHLIPSTMINNMSSMFMGSKYENEIIKIIASIVYNSIDIFKISIIIIISGFSYISRPVSKITAAVWGVWCGCSILHCSRIIISDTLNNKVIILIIVASALYCSVFASNCVNSEIAAQKFSTYRDSKHLFSSDYFWKYVGNFLISFGYILIIYIGYTFLFNILK